MSKKEQVLAALRAAIAAVEAGGKLKEATIIDGLLARAVDARALLGEECPRADGAPDEDLAEAIGAVVVPYCRVVESVEPDEDGVEVYRYCVKRWDERDD